VQIIKLLDETWISYKNYKLSVQIYSTSELKE